jgi:hypothetical protein
MDVVLSIMESIKIFKTLNWYANFQINTHRNEYLLEFYRLFHQLKRSMHEFSPYLHYKRDSAVVNEAYRWNDMHNCDKPDSWNDVCNDILNVTVEMTREIVMNMKSMYVYIMLKFNYLLFNYELNCKCKSYMSFQVTKYSKH